jgi:hypothetical protein
MTAIFASMSKKNCKIFLDLFLPNRTLFLRDNPIKKLVIKMTKIVLNYLTVHAVNLEKPIMI